MCIRDRSRRPATPTAPLGGRRAASGDHVALPHSMKVRALRGLRPPGDPRTMDGVSRTGEAEG
eukprot:7371744-Alexandrium_andersonii.AAC.1